MTRLLTSNEYAARLGIRSQTARRQRMTGRGPRFLRLGNGPSGRVFYKEEDVLRWLADQPTFSSTIEEKQHLLSRGDSEAARNRQAELNLHATSGESIRNPQGR